MKYFHFKSYVISQLILEIWFQWELISRLSTLTKTSTQTAGVVLIVSHWLFWIGGLLNVIAEHEEPKLSSPRKSLVPVYSYKTSLQNNNSNSNSSKTGSSIKDNPTFGDIINSDSPINSPRTQLMGQQGQQKSTTDLSRP
eukprot:UN06088